MAVSAPWRAMGTVKKEFGAGQFRRLALRRAAGRRRRQRRRKAEASGSKARSGLDWLGLMVVSLPGLAALAALAALLFTWMQVGQANKQLRISEQGQITNRFNAAITNLGSDSVDVPLGGVYGLERIMQDSVRDHPTVVSVLTAYVRRHAPLPEAGVDRKQTVAPAVTLPTDVEAAMGVLAERPLEVETFGLDVNRTDLRGLRSGQGGSRFAGMIFQEADLSGADLSGADLTGADLTGADLTNADLTGTVLRGSSLAGATLSVASVSGADLNEANLNKADLSGADLTGARLTGAELNGAVLSSAVLKRTTFRTANMNGSNLTGADLKGADLTDARLAFADLTLADLTGANLTGADMSDADLTGAILTGVRLTGAKLDGVRGLPPSRR
ncbi:pentapeptide repeat-containing protein [Streptomyces pratensis]|uniref:pentapeptide repeat-containing protein n=1 Tax=Streptomyces pratensis TaxID=1169025 RepID=UPI001933B49E|nr:pentapeptide repeat-containing protein [Streptomyces pratensis]